METRGNLHDPLGPGDKATGEAVAKFEGELRADPLLIFRIASSVGLNRGRVPTEAITRICRDNVTLLGEVPKTDVIAHIEECLLARDVDQALEWLQVIGAIELFLPELDATLGLAQEAGRRHKNVWEHTKLVVKQSVRRPAVRWAALLHDIGKVPTRTFTKKGVHFHGHAEVGARMFDKIARRLPFEQGMRKKIRFLIKYHLRSAQYDETWTDSAIRRFHREMQKHLTDLLDLSRADITSRRPGRRRYLLGQISQLQQRIREINEQDAKIPPLPTGIGNAIMKHFGIPPSRRIGELKKKLEQAIERGELEERREDEYYIAWLEAERAVEPEAAPAK